MDSQDLLTIILAAGKGTRMKSNLIKVLHPVAGKPMIEHIVDAASGIEKEMEIVCVIGHQGSKVKANLGNKYKYVEQNRQLGTGHAVMQAKNILNEYNGPVLILCGDTPLLRKKTLARFVDFHSKKNADLSVLTAMVENPSGYGRIVRNAEGTEIQKIIEETDASSEEKKINEINSGVYCFESRMLLEALDSLSCDNAQGEYYLTDAVRFLAKHNKKIIPMVVEDSSYIKGVNTRVDLAEAESKIRRRINRDLMLKGVSIIDPGSTYIDCDVKIGKDTSVFPFTYIEKGSEIGSGCKIAPYCRVINSRIGNDVELKSGSIIRESNIDSDCQIGPYAYIRPGCKIGKNVKIGDFVELKKARIKSGAKVPHLSYVGDAQIGKKTNIGAGTIFANYDGVNKHRTIVGDSAFIGSNTTLVAPLEIGDRAKTGAGSVVTRNVLRDTTVLGVPARVYKKKN